jgi:hypothetical protein
MTTLYEGITEAKTTCESSIFTAIKAFEDQTGLDVIGLELQISPITNEDGSKGVKKAITLRLRKM